MLAFITATGSWPSSRHSFSRLKALVTVISVLMGLPAWRRYVTHSSQDVAFSHSGIGTLSGSNLLFPFGGLEGVRSVFIFVFGRMSLVFPFFGDPFPCFWG